MCLGMMDSCTSYFENSGKHSTDKTQQDGRHYFRHSLILKFMTDNADVVLQYYVFLLPPLSPQSKHLSFLCFPVTFICDSESSTSLTKQQKGGTTSLSSRQGIRSILLMDCINIYSHQVNSEFSGFHSLPEFLTYYLLTQTGKKNNMLLEERQVGFVSCPKDT